MHSFQVIGIDHTSFEPLFELSDEQLSRIGAERHVAAESQGCPCRVSLQDAKQGEELLLLPFVHQTADSPYHASGPIFVRRGVKQRMLGVGELTEYVTTRLLSVRAYDAADMIIDASVCEGIDVRAEIERLLGDKLVAYIHLHNARRGCFLCHVNRVWAGARFNHQSSAALMTSRQIADPRRQPWLTSGSWQPASPLIEA